MISIIVPIYNVEKFINNCIESILNQSYKNIEIILVDDGSPDNCPKICDDYAKKDNRIKVIHKENGGLVSARKAGLEAAVGEYVTFVDGDDWISPDMYKEVADSITRYSPDMVITNFFWSFDDHSDVSKLNLKKEYYNRNDILSEIIPKMLFNGVYYQFGVYPNCWTKIVKRDILINNLNYVDNSIRMGEDASFTYGCIMDANSISVVNKALYYYRNTDSSMSNAYDKTLESYWYLPYQIIKYKAKKNGINIYPQLSYYLLYLINFYLRNEAKSSNNKSKTGKNISLDKLLSSDMLVDLNNIDVNRLPLHTKLLYFSLKNRNKLLLKIYIKLLGLKLK